MRVDFYQLSRDPVEDVVPRIASRLLDSGERLIVVAHDTDMQTRISAKLWDSGPTSFLAHGKMGEGKEGRQPILIADQPVPDNNAKNIIFADGIWREPSEGIVRVFHFFTLEQVDTARTLWRDLKDKAEERHYWAQEDGRWTEKG